jgi:transcription initiation factor TFIIIB Brf1 subunit/transcription initiation factor TFIIB
MEELDTLIDELVSRIGLPQRVRDDARMVASRMIESRIAVRAQAHIVAVASVLVACRLNNIGVGVKQVAPLLPGKLGSRMTAKRAFELARRYVEVFKPQVGVASYEDYVKMASKILGIPEDAERVAEMLVKAFKEKYGRKLKPMAVAGAAIYVVLSETGKQKIPMSMICSKLNVTEPTLRNAVRHMKTIRGPLEGSYL